MPTQNNIIRKVSPDGNTQLELNWYTNGSVVNVEITVNVPGSMELKVTPLVPTVDPNGHTIHKYEYVFQNPAVSPGVVSNHTETYHQEIGQTVRDVFAYKAGDAGGQSEARGIAY